MKTKILSVALLVCLFQSGCLDTRGTLSYEVWIDAPLNDATFVVGAPGAIMAHSNTQTDQMFLLIDGVPLIELGVTQVSGNLWEGTGTWTPVSPGGYRLKVRGIGSDTQIDSSEVRITVLETRSYPMEYITPTATQMIAPTPGITETAWPPVQVQFRADSLIIVRGGCTTLHWEVNYATGVALNGEYVAQMGDRQVCPSDTTTYNLRAEAPAGNVEQAVIITVNVPPPPPVDTRTPTPTTKPPTEAPPDTSGPSVTNLSHSPNEIFDGSTCGAVSANIQVKAGDPSGISKVELTYRVVKGPKAGVWRTLNMSHAGGKQYQGTLGFAELQASMASYGGGIVEYYVKAWDSKGNVSQSGTQSFEVKICLI